MDPHSSNLGCSRVRCVRKEERLKANYLCIHLRSYKINSKYSEGMTMRLCGGCVWERKETQLPVGGVHLKQADHRVRLPGLLNLPIPLLSRKLSRCFLPQGLFISVNWIKKSSHLQSLLWVFFFFFFFILTWGYFFIDFRERRSGGERQTSMWERKHWLCAFPYVPQPGTEPTAWVCRFPWLGIEPATFQSMGQQSNQLSHTSHSCCEF